MADAAKDYAAGFAAGVATVLVGHPFDTVKVKLQTQNTEANRIKYRGGLHCIFDILKTGGVRGFYKGATASFVGVATESSLLFGAYSQMKIALQGQEISEPKISSILPAAAISGACISVILCPTELVKIQANNVIGSNTVRLMRYDGPLDCVQKTVRSDGLRGLFKGGLSTLLRECTGNSVFFMTYEFTRYHLLLALNRDKARKLSREPGPKDLYGKKYSNLILEGVVDVVSGGLAGTMFWAVVLPFDVAKTRIQTAIDPKISRSPIYNMKLIYKERGFRGLYAGLAPTLARAFPANAAAMVTWELTARLLGVHRHELQV